MTEEGQSISAYQIVGALKKKRDEFEIYELRQSYVDIWNEQVAVPSFIENVFGSESAKLKRDIPRPIAYTGQSFENTTPTGGYGQPSYGMQEIRSKANMGYKPFGSMGEGPDDDLSVTLGTGQSVMLVQLMHGSISEFTDWDQTTYASPNEIISLEMGAYPWASAGTLATPVRPGSLSGSASSSSLSVHASSGFDGASALSMGTVMLVASLVQALI